MRSSDHHLTDQDLLMALDQELPARQRTAVEAHLEQCPDCRARREQVDSAARECSAFYCRDLAEPAEIHDQPARERLRARLNDMGRVRESWWASPLPARATWMPRWAMLGAALVATAWLIQVAAPSRLEESARVLAAVERGALPSATLTPGATWNIGPGELCAAGATEVRQTSLAVRQQVLRNYSMENVPPDEYELDFLITPELGGAPDARNLWPQRYASRVWNAHVKDELERLLPRLVCEGRVPLETAQREIARDWIGAYQKYFRTAAPLQTEAHRITGGGFESRDGDDLKYPVWRSASAPRLELIAFAPRR